MVSGRRPNFGFLRRGLARCGLACALSPSFEATSHRVFRLCLVVCDLCLVVFTAGVKVHGPVNGCV